MNKDNYMMERKTLLILFALFIFHIGFTQSLTANAGGAANVCKGESRTIGGTPSATGGVEPYTYSWQPAADLSSGAEPNPSAKPNTTTEYTLTVTDAAGTTATSTINVEVLPLPNVSAGIDQTMLSGGSTVLQGTGADKYFWVPTKPLTNQNTATPSATPVSTTTFCLTGVGSNGCSNYDCMIVVVEPSDELIFYNSFTPNSDGTNDFFYIGNIEHYPDNILEVYNRNGKLVYRVAPYLGKWNGEVDGNALPCATYYYILEPGRDKPVKRGAITIIR